MKPTLLFYNIAVNDREKLQSMLTFMNYNVIFVHREDYLQAIGFLVSLDGYQSTPDKYHGPEFKESMLLMAHMSETQSDQLLAMLKLPGMPQIKRKVMLTPTNQNWTSLALYEHISAEIAATLSSN